MHQHSKVPTDESAEAALAQRAASEPDAFAEIYQLYVDVVYAFVRSRVGNEADVQDITAQTFMAALSAIKRYDPAKASLKTWLIGIARHKMVDYFRRHRSKVALDAVAEIKQPGPSVHEQVRMRLDMDAIRAGLAELADDRAEVIQLRIIAGLSTAETASIMGRSNGSVKMLLMRALRDLRRTLGVDISGETMA